MTDDQEFVRLYGEIAGLDDAIEQMSGTRNNKAKKLIRILEERNYGFGITKENRTQSIDFAITEEGWRALGIITDV